MHDAIRWFKCKLKPPKNELNTLFLFTDLEGSRGEGSRGEGRGGDVRRVMLREDSEWERYVIQSITFQDQVSVSFNWLNQRRSLKEFRTECIKEHCVSLSNQLYCIVGG